MKEGTFHHIVPIQIRFNDTDQLEHVNNSVYQQYYDLGRLDYFEDVLHEHMNWEVEGLIMASITIDFLMPIRLFDKIEVRARFMRLVTKASK